MATQWELAKPAQDKTTSWAQIWQAQAVVLQKNIQKAIDQWQSADQIKSTILQWWLWYTPEQIQAQIDVVTKSNKPTPWWQQPAKQQVSVAPVQPAQTPQASTASKGKYVFGEDAMRANENNPQYIEKRNQELAAQVADQYNPDDSSSLLKATQSVLAEAWINQAKWVTQQDVQNTVQNIQTLAMTMKFGDDVMNKIQNTSSRELVNQLIAWTLSENDMGMKALKVSNPAKYQEVIQMRNDAQRYDSYNKSLETWTGTDIVASSQVLDKTSIWADIMSWSFGTTSMDVSEVYNQFLNTDVIQAKTEAKNQLQLDLNKIDEELFNLKDEIEEEYKGKVFSESAIAAIYNDRSEALDKKKRTKLLELNAAIADLNSVQEQWSRNYELYLKQKEMDRQATQDKMSQLWFAMQLMSYETPQQKDDREWAKFIREQEYATGNIESSDPATRKKAIENAVDGVLAEFAWIPMVRSREQMVEDIQAMIDSWKSLWQAITENIRAPIQQKPEYRAWLNKRLWIDTSKNVVDINGIDYLMDDEWNFYPVPDTSTTQWSAIDGLRTDRHNNPIAVAVSTWWSNNFTKALDAAWISWSHGDVFPDNPNMQTIKFNDPAQWREASRVLLWETNALTGRYAKNTSYASWLRKLMSSLGISTKEDFAWASSANQNKIIEYIYSKEVGNGSLLPKAMQWGGSYNPNYVELYKQINSGKSPSASFLKASWLDYKQLAQEATAYLKSPEVVEWSLSTTKRINEIIHDLRSMSVDSTWAAWRWRIPFTEARDFKTKYNELKAIMWLETYINAKRYGATFGALSNAELEFINNVASWWLKLSTSKSLFEQWLDRIYQANMRLINSMWWSTDLPWATWSNTDNALSDFLQWLSKPWSSNNYTTSWWYQLDLSTLPPDN